MISRENSLVGQTIFMGGKYVFNCFNFFFQMFSRSSCCDGIILFCDGHWIRRYREWSNSQLGVFMYVHTYLPHSGICFGVRSSTT